jgi:hypothetical protein
MKTIMFACAGLLLAGVLASSAKADAIDDGALKYCRDRCYDTMGRCYISCPPAGKDGAETCGNGCADSYWSCVRRCR